MQRAWRVLSIGMIAILAVSFLPSPVKAAEGLEISPPLVELQGDPGQVINSSIKVRNITGQVQSIYSQIDDFEAQGEDGKPALILKSLPDTPFSMKTWIKPIATFSLKPQEVREVPFSITIPLNGTPGGHYGVVRFSNKPPEPEGTGVGLGASVGTLVLLRVSGTVVDKLMLESFTTAQGGDNKTFFQRGPIDLTERFKNDGNDHVRPQGSVTIKDWLGKTVTTLQVNDSKGAILPGSVRKFEQKLDKPMFGRYSAKLLVAYGADNQQLESTVTFWVLPIKTLGLGLLLLIALFLLLRFYNRMIIKRAAKRRR